MKLAVRENSTTREFVYKIGGKVLLMKDHMEMLRKSELMRSIRKEAH